MGTQAFPSINFGVRPDAVAVCGAIRHEQTGLLVDPELGAIYSARLGRPVGVVCKDGYVRLGGRGVCLYAHRIVYEATKGELPPGLEIDHVNGEKSDNRACNLEAVTRGQNQLRAIALGLAPSGAKRGHAKLTDDLVMELRRTVGIIASAEWSRRLGIATETIKQARRGKTWRHVTVSATKQQPADLGARGGES